MYPEDSHNRGLSCILDYRHRDLVPYSGYMQNNDLFCCCGVQNNDLDYQEFAKRAVLKASLTDLHKNSPINDY